MKRYRVVKVTFDTKPLVLAILVKQGWPQNTQATSTQAKQFVRDIQREYGIVDSDRKLRDFIALGSEPSSVVAFYNTFLRQCRTAFVAGSYYPSLTGACALGERILNHMVLKLRDHYRCSSYYKKVYKKSSFDNWDLAIRALQDWDVLVTIESLQTAGVDTTDYGSEVADLFSELSDLRNDALHFRVDLDTETRKPALRAIKLLQEIVYKQFGDDWRRPWFIAGARGPSYIKKELEGHPFIVEFYLPACVYVGPNYRLTFENNGWHVHDRGPYEHKEITDEEFVTLANLWRAGQSL